MSGECDICGQMGCVEANHAARMTPDELRAARARLGLTQAELAEWLCVGLRTVKGWESGRSPVPRAVEIALQCREKEAG